MPTFRSVPPPVSPPPTSSVSGKAEIELLRQALKQMVDRICPPQLARQADDLVQTALIRVTEILRRDEGNRELSASYLWRAAYSALVDELRRQRRRQEVALPEEESVLPAAPRHHEPERFAVSREIGRGIRECLGQLARPRRLVVTLHLQGHSLREAAELLGWEAKRTDNLLYRGLADLRRCLSAKGLEP